MDLGNKISLIYNPVKEKNLIKHKYDLILEFNQEELQDLLVKEVFEKDMYCLEDKIIVYNVGENVDEIIRKIKECFRIKKEKEGKAEEMNKAIQLEFPPDTTFQMLVVVRLLFFFFYFEV